MEVMVCVGDSCQSKEVINKLNCFIKENNIQNKVSLKGSFCMGKCSSNGISIKIDDDIYSVSRDNVQEFFEKEILGRLDW